MNIHKIRSIVNYIKKQGKLPTDPYGQSLSVENMIAWFGLDGHLSLNELRLIKEELSALIEAEQLLMQLQGENI